MFSLPFTDISILNMVCYSSIGSCGVRSCACVHPYCINTSAYVYLYVKNRVSLAILAKNGIVCVRGTPLQGYGSGFYSRIAQFIRIMIRTAINLEYFNVGASSTHGQFEYALIRFEWRTLFLPTLSFRSACALKFYGSFYFYSGLFFIFVFRLEVLATQAEKILIGFVFMSPSVWLYFFFLVH